MKIKEYEESQSLFSWNTLYEQLENKVYQGDLAVSQSLFSWNMLYEPLWFRTPEWRSHVSILIFLEYAL